jgi:hypothetical protein
VSDFDPLAILGALERHRVAYVLVGDLAGVLHGTDLTADTVEITPSLKPENSERLHRALDDLGVTEKWRAPLRALTPDIPSFAVPSTKGQIRITPMPPGTGGYADLRRAAHREPLGLGIRTPVASVPDLIRCLPASGLDVTTEQRLRRLVDLQRELALEI